jgi:uncharacterized damage-inducible protein DinB
MTKKLEQLFLNLEEQRITLLEDLQTRSSPQLAAKPSSDAWSVLEILTHLYTAERLSFEYIKKKSQGIEHLDNAGIQQSLLVPILKISQRLPFKFKAPNVVKENTPEAYPLQELINQWDLLRMEIKSHLENTLDNHVDKLVYKHPIAGRLSLPQALQFFAEHITHHKSQIKRTLLVNDKH